MAYGFPVGYQSYGYQPYGYQTYYPQYGQGMRQDGTPQNETDMKWVQGEAGAKAVIVEPRKTVTLWDSESQIIYLKSADATGMPSMKILRYEIVEDASKTPKTAPKIDFATKDDVFSIQKQIDEIKANLSGRKGAEHESTVSADESGRQ
jgi:hypothetical protein